MDELDDRELIDPEVQLAGLNKSPRRKKGLSRLYFSTFSFVLLVVVLVSVISLGTFGVKQNDFNKLKDTLHPSGHYCILFSSYAGYDEEHKDSSSVIYNWFMCLRPVGPDIGIDRVCGMAGVFHSFSHHRGTNVSYAA